MESFVESVELVRITFLFGALCALLYKKNTGITPGGIIVPAFLAIILDTNFKLFCILLLITAACVVLYRLIFSTLALPHRWTLIINIAMSTGLLFGLQYLMQDLLPYTDVTAFGFVLPGLIASACYYQSPRLVGHATLLVTAATYSFGWLLFQLIPYALSSKLTVELASFAPIIISHPHFAIPMSLLAAGISYQFFNARSGGYLIAPVITAVITTSMLQFELFLLGVAVAYLLIKLLLQYSLLIGLERFVLILFLSAALVTAMDLFAVSTGLQEYRSSPIILIIAMAVWVNDLCLQPIRKSAGGGFSLPVAASLALTKVWH